MQFDFETLESDLSYKLLTATVVPRPIAWVTTLDQDGVLNTGVFSFFNIMGKEPPLVAFCISASKNVGEFKGSAANILSQNEFVVNLVTEKLSQQMNLTAMDAPLGFDELAVSGLTIQPSFKIKTPRIAQSPVSLECVNHTTILTGPNQLLVIGRVVAAHIDDAFILDKERCYVDTQSLKIIGRMHGGGFYNRTDDLFEIKRISYEKWREENNKM